MRFTTEVGKLDKAELGKRFHQVRTIAGLSQRKMAAMMGYNSPTAISNKEKGITFPSVEDLYFLSKISGVSIEWLVTGEDSKKQLHNMNEMEASLLMQYRQLDPAQQVRLAFYLMTLRLGIRITNDKDMDEPVAP